MRRRVMSISQPLKEPIVGSDLNSPVFFATTRMVSCTTSCASVSDNPALMATL